MVLHLRPSENVRKNGTFPNNVDCKEVIFEGAESADNSSFINAHYDRTSLHARQQLKAAQQGAQLPKWKAYKERYGNQPVEIIEGFTRYERPPHSTEVRTEKKIPGKKRETPGRLQLNQ